MKTYLEYVSIQFVSKIAPFTLDKTLYHITYNRNLDYFQCFTSLSTVFRTCRDNNRIIMKLCAKELCLWLEKNLHPHPSRIQTRTARSIGRRFTYRTNGLLKDQVDREIINNRCVEHVPFISLNLGK